MARVNKARLAFQMRTATGLGHYSAKGPGQLVLNHSGYGFHVALVVSHSGGEIDLSPTGLTAKEVDLWLSGFNHGLDAERCKSHWLKA